MKVKVFQLLVYVNSGTVKLHPLSLLKWKLRYAAYHTNF